MRLMRYETFTEIDSKRKHHSDGSGLTGQDNNQLITHTHTSSRAIKNQFAV